MRENLSGLIKLFGISFLLVVLWVAIGLFSSGNAMGADNVQNVLERSSLYAIIGIGVAFVIMTGGIDLSLGSLACLSACLFVWMVQVSYSPQGEMEVYEAKKSDNDSFLVVSGSEDQFAEEQWLRLFPAKGARIRTGVLKVTSVEKGSAAGTVRIGVSPSPSRSETSKDGKAIASVVKLNQIEKLQLIAEKEGATANSKFEDRYDVLPSGQGNSKEATGSILSVSESTQIDSANFAKKNRIVFVSESGSLGEASILGHHKAQSGDTVLELDRKSSLSSGKWHWFVMKRKARMNLYSALVLTLLFAASIGVLHGILVAFWNLQPFVVTLCGFMIYRGAARWLTDDQSVGFGTEYSDTWMTFSREPISTYMIIPGSGEYLSVPVTFFVLAVIAILAVIFMNLTIWGRYLLATGRNEQASRFSGINTAAIKMVAYTMCGLLAAIAGLINVMDTGDISPTNGCNYWELYAIAAAVLGGCSLRGGEGSILGVVIGATLMQTIKNGVILLGIPNTVELAVLGVVIMFGVSFDEIVRRVLAMRRASPSSTENQVGTSEKQTAV